MKTTNCAVLMGDIVNSQQAENPQIIHRIFNKEIDQINDEMEAQILSPLTITLGDEFQGLIKTLLGAFKIAFDIRYALLRKSVTCRFVIGSADIKTKINYKLAWNMMGPGLAEARTMLGKKEDINCYRFSLPDDKKTEKLLNGIGLSLTAVENKWTSTQLKYVMQILSETDASKGKIAKDLAISENTLYKVLRSADFHFYLQQRTTIEEVLSMIDNEPVNTMGKLK